MNIKPRGARIIRLILNAAFTVDSNVEVSLSRRVCTFNRTYVREPNYGGVLVYEWSFYMLSCRRRACYLQPCDGVSASSLWRAFFRHPPYTAISRVQGGHSEPQHVQPADVVLTEQQRKHSTSTLFNRLVQRLQIEFIWRGVWERRGRQ